MVTQVPIGYGRDFSARAEAVRTLLPPPRQGWNVIYREADRIRVRRVVVEVSIERTTIRVVVIVTSDIREIRRIDIAIVGETIPNNSRTPQSHGLPYRLPGT